MELLDLAGKGQALVCPPGRSRTEKQTNSLVLRPVWDMQVEHFPKSVSAYPDHACQLAMGF